MKSTLALVLGLVLFGLCIAQEQGRYSYKPIENYMFGLYNQSVNKVEPRSGAVVGVTGQTDSYSIFVLSGENFTNTLSSNYVFDVSSRTWTSLNLNFSRAGSCYSQDSNANKIWIFGGKVAGTSNNDPFVSFDLTSKTFATLASPPNGVSLTGASCAIGADSKFYVLTVSESAFEDDESFATCTSKLIVFDGKNWSEVQPNGTVPAFSEASAFSYKNSIVVYGGRCGSTYSGDVYRFDLNSHVWTKDTPTGTPFAASSVAATYVDSEESIFVVGGLTSSGSSDEAHSYNLGNNTWTFITNSTSTEGRYGAGVAAMVNRVFILGGQADERTYLDDILQLVLEKSCSSYGCEDCTSTDGCGWCGAAAACIAGGQNDPFLYDSCNSTDNYINDLDSCPQVFPSYGIALLVIGGVVVVGIIIFAIMKVRSEDQKEGYERIS